MTPTYSSYADIGEGLQHLTDWVWLASSVNVTTGILSRRATLFCFSLWITHDLFFGWFVGIYGAVGFRRGYAIFYHVGLQRNVTFTK